ncbi:large ribosomal subunit protein mL66 [Ciona intestinalis]
MASSFGKILALSKHVLLPKVNLNNMLFHIPTRSYRQIEVKEDGNVTTFSISEIHNLHLSLFVVKTMFPRLLNITLQISGKVCEEKITNYAQRLNQNDLCPLRSRGIHITPYDVLILNQFITSDGDILSQSETGLSRKEYFKVIACVKMAQRANMLPGSERQVDMHGIEVPKLNRYLTRYQIGSRTPIKSRGLWYRKRYFKVGDARSVRDAPRVSRRPITDNL